VSDCQVANGDFKVSNGDFKILMLQELAFGKKSNMIDIRPKGACTFKDIKGY
jgi:hypothetical protein